MPNSLRLWQICHYHWNKRGLYWFIYRYWTRNCKFLAYIVWNLNWSTLWVNCLFIMLKFLCSRSLESDLFVHSKFLIWYIKVRSLFNDFKQITGCSEFCTETSLHRPVQDSEHLANIFRFRRNFSLWLILDFEIIRAESHFWNEMEYSICNITLVTVYYENARSTASSTLAFTLATTTTGATFSIKVSQIECSSLSK